MGQDGVGMNPPGSRSAAITPTSIFLLLGELWYLIPTVGQGRDNTGKTPELLMIDFLLHSAWSPSICFQVLSSSVTIGNKAISKREKTQGGS